MISRSDSADRPGHKGRVGMLVHATYPADVRVRRQAETLAASGFEVHVICVRPPAKSADFSEARTDAVNGVTIHRLPLRKKRGTTFRYLFEFSALLLLGVWKVTALHLRRRFDVVHIHNMPDLLVFAGLPAKWMGARLLLDVHDPMPELFQENYGADSRSPMVRALQWQERISFGRVDRLITVSDPMADNIARKAGVSKEAVMVVHNFPDLNYFPIRKNRARWPHDDGRFVFLYAGTVSEHYRLDIALRALAKISPIIPGVRFQILGNGPALKDVLSLAQELGVPHLLEVLPAVSMEKVKDYMAAADVGITTHQSGIFGDLYLSNKVIEYMTQGLPVVCSRTRSLAQYIPEEAIFFFRPGDIDGLSDTLVTICQNPHLVQARIDNAQILLTRYVWQTEREKFVSFYSDVVRANP